ncbi:hypothetical protein FRC01_006489, partial [Tulasnella sp. 417]
GAGRKLREIRLDNFMVPWEWPSLPSLEHLELRCIREGPTVAQVLEIISGSPLLKECIIFQARIRPLVDTTSQGAPIKATHLRKVEFDSIRLDSVVQILNNLLLSRGCVIDVIAKNHDSSFRPFLDYVRRRLPEVEDETRKWTTSVAIYLTSSPNIMVSFPHNRWELNFRLTDPRWTDAETRWAAYCDVLEEARSGFLHVDGDPGVNLFTFSPRIDDTLKRIHDVYPNLTFLCTVTDSHTLELFSRPQLLNPTDQDKRWKWMFPNLQNLHLYHRPDINGIVEFIESRRNNEEVKPITRLVVDDSPAPEDPSNVIHSGDASEIDQEVIVRSLQLLLSQLMTSGQGISIDPPLTFSDSLQALDSLTSICKEIEAGADWLVADHSKKRNQFLPIHQLPPKVLIRVFRNALSLEEYSRKSHTTTYLHRQKELRLVCAHWNETIRAEPYLWTTITCADVYQNRLHMAIKLSETAALDIVCCAGRKSRSRARCRSLEAEMKKLAHRWGSLNAHGSYLIDTPISVVPELLVLGLHGTTGLCSVPPPGSSQFLGEAAAKLRKICLDNFMVPWEWPNLPSLEHLELWCIREGPTVAQVLEIISRAPLLKECILYQTQIQPIADSASRHAPIETTHLRKVEFDSIRLDSVVQILNSLLLSKGCIIKVVTNNHDSSFRPFLDYVRRRLPEIEDQTRDWTTSVAVDITSSPEIVLAFPNHESQLSFTLIDPRWTDIEAKWKAYRGVLEEARRKPLGISKSGKRHH